MDALQAATLLRFSPQHCRLAQADGTTFAVIPWLQSQKEDREICETEGYAVQDRKRVKVRVLALRLPAERARQRVLARAKRKQQAVRPETLSPFWMGLAGKHAGCRRLVSQGTVLVVSPPLADRTAHQTDETGFAARPVTQPSS